MFVPINSLSLSDCSTVGLSCVTTTWQRTFMSSLQVTVGDVLPRVSVERR